MQRYSKNREAIIECLMNTDEHPTAEWIYAKLKPDHPSISLATVYRNLAQLKEAGVIRSVGTVKGQERFDAKIVPHTHLVCTVCGKMTDIEDITLPKELSVKISESTGYSVKSYRLRFDGVCSDCKSKIENNKN